MKEKLELKHLAHFLPYGLKIKDCLITKPFILDTVNLYSVLSDIEHLNTISIILRPLSDLTKEIEHDGERFVPINYISCNYSCFGFDYNINDGFILNTDVVNYKYLPYMILHKLFEWHFDVFGLIDKGLAIDINTLK